MWSFHCTVLKHKLRQIKRVYSSKNGFQAGSVKPGVVRSIPGMGSSGRHIYREKMEAKQGNH